MIITQTFTWQATNWPTPTSAATQYTVFQVYPAPVTPVQTVSNTTEVILSFDDSLSWGYQIRPSQTIDDVTTYGPEVTVFTVNYVPCRGWLRDTIRDAIADRADSTVTTTVNWPDDELNTYIQEALGEFNLMFPTEEWTTITLLPPVIDENGNTVGVRAYDLPADFYLLHTVEYVTYDGKLHMYFKEKPWRGGETTATSYLGYPKLGILVSPLSGRYFPGHYFVYDKQVIVDFDPAGNGDMLNLAYYGKRPIPVNDGDILELLPEDMTILSLCVQMKCWMRVEGQDARLSRWRTREDGGKRDDMSTVKQLMMIKQLYDQRVNDRRELRPKTRRLVRR